MALAMLIGLLIFPNQLHADVNVLIIGSTKDSGEMHPANVWASDKKAPHVPTSKPFSPTEVRTQLQNILAQDGRGAVNVTVLDRYRADAISQMPGWNAYSYNLATWFHYPYPAGAETNRWANLRGEAGTAWDYVVLIGDPYTMEYTPGMYAHGVAKIAEEVAKGSAELILLMPWPASGSSSSIDHYKEVVYRTGRSGGHKIAPGGLAWQAIKSTARTDPNPDNDGAYIAAASIYSSIYNQSAAASTYVYNDTHANTTFTTYTNNNNASQYTGTFTFQNPYKILADKKRAIRMSERGTSTEEGFKGKIKSAMDRSRVTYAEYNDGTYTTTLPNIPNGTVWTTNPMPIDFNYGRDGFYSEPEKSYLANPTYWQLGFGYYYQNGGSHTVENFNDFHIALMQEQDNDLANRMINEAPTARNIPVRSLWAQIHKEYPTLSPMRDTQHLSFNLDEAVGTYIYTIFSGRCPLDPKPATDDIVWTCRKIGYETAWRLGRCQSRAPGFKVMPSVATKKSITPGEKETMTVQFILPPQQDITVNVSVSNPNAAVVGSKQLVFTPQNYNIPQNVSVAGLPGSAASEVFNVVFTTVSTDEVYDALDDTWDYTITRSAPVTLTRVDKGITQVNANQNLPLTINLNTAGAISANTTLAGPSRGTAVWSGSNVIYTPASDFVGKDGFSFATNNAGTLSIGYIEITVTGAVPNGMVSYRGNGSESGAVPIDAATYAQNSSVTVLNNTGNLFRVGYNFDGWNTAENGTGTSYAPGATFTMGSSWMVLYAKWRSVPTYTVSYNGNTNNGGAVPANQIKTEGVNLTLAANSGALTKTGHTFVGWNTATNGTGTDYTAGGAYSGNANIALFAKWTPNNYTVTFNANGGATPSPASKVVTYASTYGTLATVSYPGYTFNGWFTAATAGTQVLPSTAVSITANQTLFAQWTLNTSYAVSYNANSADTGTVPPDQTKLQDVALTLAINTGGLARSGFTFAGWNTADNGSGTPYAAGASYTNNLAVILYAQWAGAATYEITYNGNSNTGGTAPSNQTKNQGVSLALAANSGNLNRTGFSFAGWNTAMNGGGTSYAVGAPYAADSALALYARWNALPAVNAGANQSVTLNAGTAWSPTSLTPQLWLDADDTNTITLNGGTVSQWTDKSGFNRHATALTTAQPTATNTGLNGKRVITFDGATDVLDVNLDFLVGVNHSAFIVTKPTIYSNIYGAANGNAGANSLHVGFASSTAYRMNYWGNDYAPAVTANFVPGSANIMNYVWTSGTSKQILANGKSEGISTSPLPGAIGTMAGGGRIGRTTGHSFYGGDIAEFIAVTGAVSAADREKMEGYLAHKWGLADKLAAGHPHKASPPGGSGAVATLDGTVTDTDVLTYAWSVVSGPASVTFANSTAIDTTATFTVAGVYTLRLAASDGLGQASDDIVITVNTPGSNHSVSYDGNGSTGGSVPVDASSPYANGSTVTVRGNTGSLVRTGYTFNNWNTAANGSGSSYSPAATFSISTPTILYAQWTIANTAPTISNIADSSTNVGTATSAIAFTVGDVETGVASLTVSGTSSNTTLVPNGNIAFGGSGASRTVTVTPAANQSGTSTITVTVSDGTTTASDTMVLTVNTYAITYDANSATSGTAPPAQTKTHAVNLTLQNNTGTLARTGYTFSGWNTQAGGLGTPYAVGAIYTANAAVTLYAKWTMTPYTAWAGGTFANNFTAIEITGNPDSDDLTNLQEFAFGTDPTASTYAPLAYVPTGSASPGHPVLENTGTAQSPSYRAVFARRKDHGTAGISYQVLFSANLVHWKASAVVPVILSGASSAAVEAVGVPFPATVPLSAAETEHAPPQFFRVAVAAQ